MCLFLVELLELKYIIKLLRLKDRTSDSLEIHTWPIVLNSSTTKLISSYNFQDLFLYIWQ